MSRTTRVVVALGLSLAMACGGRNSEPVTPGSAATPVVAAPPPDAAIAEVPPPDVPPSDLTEPALAEQRGLKRQPRDPGAPPPTGDAATGMPQACIDYKAQLMTFSRCEKIPQETRDAMLQGVQAMESAWGSLGDLPADARAQLESGCKQGIDALKQAGAALGCGL